SCRIHGGERRRPGDLLRREGITGDHPRDHVKGLCGVTPFAAAMFGGGQVFSAFDPATLGSNTTLSADKRTATHAGTAAAGAGVACVAVDLTAHKLWVRKAGGNWNGNAAYDPAAGTGGQTIGSGTWYPAGSESDTGVYTLNVGQQAFVGLKPAGFFIWE